MESHGSGALISGIHENGDEEMAMSIIQTKATKECFLCRFKYNVETTQNLEKHHFMNGTANRRLAEFGGICAKSIIRTGLKLFTITGRKSSFSSKWHRADSRSSMVMTSGWRSSARII